MEKLLPILNDLLIVTANLIIFTRMISWKNPNLRNKIIIYTGCTIIIAAYFLATYFYEAVGHQYIVVIYAKIHYI